MKQGKALARLLIATFVFGALGAMSFAQQDQPVPSQSTPPAATHKMSKSEKGKSSAAKGRLVDVNSAEELAALPGMNPDLAQNVIDGRPYTKKTELLRKEVVPKNAYDQMQGQIIAKRPAKKK